MIRTLVLSTSCEGQNCTKLLKPRSPAVNDMQPRLRSGVLMVYSHADWSEMQRFFLLLYLCAIWRKIQCAVAKLYNYTLNQNPICCLIDIRLCSLEQAPVRCLVVQSCNLVQDLVSYLYAVWSRTVCCLVVQLCNPV